jgi:hypothetical protein
VLCCSDIALFHRIRRVVWSGLVWSGLVWPGCRCAQSRASAESFLPLAESDAAFEMVQLLLAFDRRHNDGQIDLVLALPVAAAHGASLQTVRWWLANVVAVVALVATLVVVMVLL